MEIIKYKYLNPNRYKIYITDKEYVLYENIIIKYNILSKKDITIEEINKYLNENSYYEYYYKTLNFIKFRIRSKKEIEKYLIKNKVLKDYAQKIIKSLEQEGYINDELFAKCFVIDSINLKNDGPIKIKNELLKLGIDEKIINTQLLTFTHDQQILKIKKYISKEEKINKNKSLFILKQKLLNNLIYQGFYKEDILLCLENLKVDEDTIYKKEYDKIYTKLSKKYAGNELENKIKQKLYQMGLYR